MERVLDRMSQVNLGRRRGPIIKILPWGTRIGFPIQIPKEVVILLKSLGVLVVERNTLIGILPAQMVSLDVGIGGDKMRDYLNLKAKGKEVNKAPHGGPNPNSQKNSCFYEF